MPAQDRLEIVRACYHAFATDDRDLIERQLAESFTFSAPPDVGIDRGAFFERCWPNAGHIKAFHFVRLAEVGDEVLVTYEATRSDDTRFRNTELFGFAGGQVASQEVYFGWDLS